MILNLLDDDVRFIINVLNELPTKSGAHPLVVKINQQIQDRANELHKQIVLEEYKKTIAAQEPNPPKE